jgi:hypothetical protein
MAPKHRKARPATRSTADAHADFDDNGVVNVDDILILLSQFGVVCP